MQPYAPIGKEELGGSTTLVTSKLCENVCLCLLFLHTFDDTCGLARLEGLRDAEGAPLDSPAAEFTVKVGGFSLFAFRFAFAATVVS